MKVGQQITYIDINKPADSLHSLIADGQYCATSLGRNKWKKLIGREASLQTGCNKEGFNAVYDNVHSRARIGILGNDGYCSTFDSSRIRFGLGGLHNDSNTCGNHAPFSQIKDGGPYC